MQPGRQALLKAPHTRRETRANLRSERTSLPAALALAERKGLAPGWRLLCGLWLKRPKHQAAHGAGAEAAGASGAEAGPADAPWAAGAAAPQPFGLHGQPGLTLGDLPPELMLHAIKFLAPPAPQLRALTPADQDRDS